jgi:hypothetical protein
MKKSIATRITYLKNITAEVTSEEAKYDFDRWFDSLDPTDGKNPGKIPEVTSTNNRFQPFAKRPAGSPVPICLVASTKATPSKNYLFSENAFVFYFGDIPGYPMSRAECMAEAKRLLKKYTYFNETDYYLELVSYENVDKQINRNYTMCIAVFAH